MRWSVHENHPPIAGKGGKVLLDGAEVRHVTAFDTDEGWVEAFCVDGHTGYPGRMHVDPNDPDAICARALHGRVEVVMPETGEVPA